MKKGTKITLIVLASILAFGIIVFVCADVVISRLAMKEVNKALSALPPEYGEASCGDIHVRLFSVRRYSRALVQRYGFRHGPSFLLSRRVGEQKRQHSPSGY